MSPPPSPGHQHHSFRYFSRRSPRFCSQQGGLCFFPFPIVKIAASLFSSPEAAARVLSFSSFAVFFRRDAHGATNLFLFSMNDDYLPSRNEGAFSFLLTFFFVKET